MNTSSSNTHWRVMKNIMSLVGGRIFISLSRFLIALIIVRLTNTDVFGSYVVVMSIVFIGEWIMDFGFTDIAVRNISQDKESRLSVIEAFITVKIIQALTAYGAVVLAIYILGYTELLPAIAIGGFALIFFGAAQIYRVDFRVNIAMNKDMLSETIGVVLMIILVGFVSLLEGGITELIACHTISRLIYLIGNMYQGRKFQFPFAFASKKNIALLARQAGPLGFAGLLVSLYDSIIPLTLSKLMDMEAVSHYTVAIRVVFPIVIVTQAISNVFYTPLSNYWRFNKGQFVATQQNVVEITWVIACGFFCGIYSGADFILSFFGDAMTGTSFILKALSWAIIARAMTIAMASPVIICGGQRKTMWLTLIVVFFSAFLVIYLVPIYGIYGAIGTFLFIEIAVTAIPVIFVSMYMAKYRLYWSPIFKVFLAAVFAITVTTYTNIDGMFIGSIFSFLVFVSVAYFSKGINKEKIVGILNIVKNR